MYQPPAGNRKPPRSMITAGILIAILAVVTIVSAFTVMQLPDPVTDQGKDIDLLYQPVLAISLIVFFGVTAAIIYALFRFRRTGPEIPEQVHGNNKLEFTWTAIPILILVVLFIPSFRLVLDLKTPPADDEIDITVEAVGHQWWWEFIYPDDGVRVQVTPPNYDDLTPPTMVVPVGKTVRVIVRSTDVIHSFYFPNSLYKIQAVPGNLNEMHFRISPENVGTYSGQCYQFCGTRHADMLFIVDAVSEADYERWLSEAQAAQGVIPAAAEAVAAGAGGN